MSEDSPIGRFRAVNSFAVLAQPLFDRWNELVLEHLRVQYWLCKNIYAMRHDAPRTTGEHVLTGRLIPMGTYEDWKLFFHELYGIEIDDYITAAKAENIAAVIRKYEIDQYGSSAIPGQGEEAPQEEVQGVS